MVLRVKKQSGLECNNKINSDAAEGVRMCCQLWSELWINKRQKNAGWQCWALRMKKV